MGIFNKLLALCNNDKEISDIKIGDWVKQINIGYFKVIDKTPKYAVIKQGFDSKFTYMKQSNYENHFRLMVTDLKDYQPLEHKEAAQIKAFFTDNAEEEKRFLKQTEKMLAFREKLLNADFEEAKDDFWQFNFYRYTTEKSAFILNLKDLGDNISVTYGFTSIPDEEVLQKRGVADSDIKLRFSAVVADDAEKTAASEIQKVFEMYQHLSKDEILNLKKEKQKTFLQKITDRLKPLGFKKKGTKWTQPLENDFCLEFHAQKSAWSDEYHFNISVYNSKINVTQCYYTRLFLNGEQLFDWQLMSDKEFSCLMDTAMSVLLPVINTPLDKLGEKEEFATHSLCKRNKCESCWVKKEK